MVWRGQRKYSFCCGIRGKFHREGVISLGYEVPQVLLLS